VIIIQKNKHTVWQDAYFLHVTALGTCSTCSTGEH